MADAAQEKKIKIGSATISIKGLIIIICILLLIIGFVISGASGGSSSGGSSSKNTCSVCGRVFEAGDSAGNYKSIARTHMCVNCYNNYQWAQDALGK